MRLNVNPTRMELTNLKKRLNVAEKGHKLLKDKQDELMKKFIDMIRLNNDLRVKVENELSQSLKDFMMAKAVMGTEVLEESIMIPIEEISLDISKKNIMGVSVPEMNFVKKGKDNFSIYPYGFVQTTGELDMAIKKFYDILPSLLRLAEIEKSCQLMADEIEKTRRRVNALEYIMIPQLEETIKYITMKLEENERGNIVRLMKVKLIIENE
ncbi:MULTISPECIES: V-type ATP synthase subunit D [Tissierellales]|jgi:V/A-type H+-transporting ATPase subunit D|uniref:V-type ATP synthase subunit D n=1 Tax=Acidilutibacter cellobiosedens TaxID=2507161 RepID=A0A410QA75_9FIRM|nr:MULTISPECIES: V-type ATP synthase subunit D [Tissierellales]MBE6083223.1 V-type ATP synthase subunit D [Tissierellaceae bacterium]QAT60886.1 V-type ATP synthase subunit D [Acidilutibacter cellobiosedens]SCL90665.1 V-type sodium pump subunit D [Sporanaerobacter sp. PP17-6a]